MPAFLLFLVALAPAPAAASRREREPVLVVLREKADVSGAERLVDRLERRRFVYEALRAQAEASQAPLRAALRERGAAFRSHFLVNLLTVEADGPTAAWLASRPEVARVVPNRPAALERFPPSPEPDAAPFAATAAENVQPNLALIGASELWSRGITGQGMVVGVADTGFEWTHPALRDRYRGWDGVAATHDYNWHDAVHENATLNACGHDSPQPCDDQGHGTSTSGLAVGQDGSDVIGVAPGARLIGCRNMDVGNGTPERYLECFEWFMAPTDLNGQNPRPDLAPDVISNSWGCPASEGCTDPDVLSSAVDSMRAAGFAMAFAAGNDGTRCFSLAGAPAVAPGAFAIGATALDDTIAVFSAFGPVESDGSNRLKPDLTAPGVNLRTSAVGARYTGTFTGTSGAAPEVAGAFALLWSAVPGLRGDVPGTEEILERSAVALTTATDCGSYPGSNVPNPVFGWGRLDVAHAYALAIGRGEPTLAPEARSTRTLPPRE